MPDIKKTTSRRKKQQNGWIIARKVVQGFAFLIFLVTIFLTRNNSLPYSTLSFPQRLSPLTMLANLISSRTFLAGMSLSLSLVVLSLLFGRAWCGWLCPLGTILDVFNFKKHKAFNVPEKWRAFKYAILIFILIAAIFSNLTLLFFDPLTIFTRSFTLVILPLIDSVITATERVLVTISPLRNLVIGFDQILRPAIFPAEPVVFQYSLLFGLFFIAIILLNLITERFWCRYLCPLGGLLGLISKFSLIKRTVGENCASCGLCESDCPTDTINPQDGFRSDPSECTMCMNCLDSCQKEAIRFSPGLSIAKFRQYDPSRRSILNTFFVSVAAVALLSIDWIRNFPRNHRLRPPGVIEEGFSAACIRCGLCIKVCPTHGLQPDLLETGVENISTPVLVPRFGFCQYSCNACGQICPVGAIPSLPLEEKKIAVIGKAYIDHNRCIAWSDHRSCIVCEEMCPLPDKAITLEMGEFTTPEGEKITLQLPVVNRLTCIGCGTCEFKCPVVGESAIRVYTA